MASRLRTISIAACTVALAIFVGLVVFIVASRFSYPYELEWTTGSMLDHVERVREGKPLYVEPSIDWTPFLYPPGYYWVCALFSHAMGEVAACRLVSILSSLGIAACVYGISRKLDASRALSAIASLLFLGCFGYTLQWYDIERCDALFVLLLSASALVLMRTRFAIVAGALLGCAFFVKQPASTFLVVVPIVLAIVRGPALLFALGEILVIAPLFVWQHLSTHGWFTYYVMKMPAAHGIDAKYITLFFVTDLSKAPVLTLATALVLWSAYKKGRTHDPLTSFAAFLLAGFVASASSRMHVGGWPNVLMFWTAFACPAVAWVLARIEDDRAFAGALALVALQAGAFAPDPNEAIPGAKDKAFANAFQRRMLEIEKSGEVVVLGRGHVTEHRHAHHNTIIDVMRGGRDMPHDLRDGLEQRRFAAIVIDEPAQLDQRETLGRDSGFAVVFAKNYFVAERMDDRTPPPVVGYPTLPRWVFRPRKHPLENLDREKAFEHIRVEMGLAERNMRRMQALDAHDDGLEIEDEAARAF